jgi:hypothetical protein
METQEEEEDEVEDIHAWKEEVIHTELDEEEEEWWEEEEEDEEAEVWRYSYGIRHNAWAPVASGCNTNHTMV